MSEPNYNVLFQAPNPGQAFAQSFQQGQQQQRVGVARQAMAALSQDPNNERALQALASVDPDTAMQFQQQRAEHGKQMLAQHQDNIMRGAQIIRQLQPKDDASWQHAKAVAAQAGVDVSEVPDHFDQQYVQGVVAIADAFHPEQGQQPHFLPFQQGGGVVRVNPDGTTSMVVIPNDGSQAPGAPAGSGPQPGQVEDGYRFKGGNPSDPGSWEKVGGATVSAPSSNFP